jgi:hypothetical protein
VLFIISIVHIFLVTRNRLSGDVLPLGKRRRPHATRRIARDGKFGRDYYGLLSSAKVVLNGAVDVAGEDRANMRYL